MASVDGKTVLDKPFRNTRALVPWMTWREEFKVPPGRHDVRILVKGLYRLPFRRDGRRRIVSFHAEEGRTVSVESGKSYRFRVEPKLFPHDHLVIEKED
ncbi:MAG: hypothetical protein P8018_11740 [Acidobacteriota bacterium]